MDSENPLSYYQEYDKWYQSRFDPSEWPESLVNSTHCSYNRTLMVIVHQPLYPITESVLNQVFDSFGVVEDISIVSASENVQALLRFEQYSSCFSALSSLHGRYIYDNCCKLEIHHLSKNFVDRVVRQNPLGEGIETQSFIHLRQMKLLLDYLDKVLLKSKPKTSESDCVVKVFDESPVKESKEEVNVFDESPDKETTKEAEVLVHSETKLKAFNVKSNEKQTESGGARHVDAHMMDKMLLKELTFCGEKVTEIVAYKIIGENFEKVRSNEKGSVQIVKFKMKLGETVGVYDLFRKLKKVKMRSLRTRLNCAGQFGDSREASEDETDLQKFIFKPVKDAYINLLFDPGGSSSQLVDVSGKHRLRSLMTRIVFGIGQYHKCKEVQNLKLGRMEVLLGQKRCFLDLEKTADVNSDKRVKMRDLELVFRDEAGTRKRGIAIDEALGTCTLLKKIGLRGNNFGVEAGLALSKVLSVFSDLTEIYLIYLYLEDEGSIDLANALKESAPSLEVLVISDLSENEFKEKVAILIGKALDWKMVMASHADGNMCGLLNRRHFTFKGIVVADASVLPSSLGAAQPSKLKGLEQLHYKADGYNFWTWRDMKLHYVVEGDGPLIVLIHGFGASTLHWRYNISELAKHFKVYAIDLLGFGVSEKDLVDYDASWLSNEEPENSCSDFSLPFEAANVASQWLELLSRDIGGHLEILRQSKSRVLSIITTELSLLVSRDLSSKPETGNVDAHIVRPSSLIQHMALQSVNKYGQEKLHLSGLEPKYKMQPTGFFCNTVTTSDTSTLMASPFLVEQILYASLRTRISLREGECQNLKIQRDLSIIYFRVWIYAIIILEFRSYLQLPCNLGL